MFSRVDERPRQAPIRIGQTRDAWIVETCVFDDDRIGRCRVGRKEVLHRGDGDGPVALVYVTALPAADHGGSRNNSR